MLHVTLPARDDGDRHAPVLSEQRTRRCADRSRRHRDRLGTRQRDRARPRRASPRIMRSLSVSERSSVLSVAGANGARMHVNARPVREKAILRLGDIVSLDTMQIHAQARSRRQHPHRCPGQKPHRLRPAPAAAARRGDAAAAAAAEGGVARRFRRLLRQDRAGARHGS